MTVTNVGGWLTGSLPDDTGRDWPVVQHRQASARGPVSPRPNLILHTTETDGYVETLRFPSQWQVGEGKIGQHIQLGLAGDAVNNWDAVAQQIEIVGRSKVGVWLPENSSLGPLVALTAWLHRSELIKTGLQRPTNWPTNVDTPPGSGLPASSTYYRRQAGLWPHVPGVYGHLEIPDNSHWDPGGFEYPAFFERVADALDQEDDMSTQDIREGAAAGRLAPIGSEPPDGSNADFRWGFSVEQRIKVARTLPEPGAPGPHEHNLQGKAV